MYKWMYDRIVKQYEKESKEELVKSNKVKINTWLELRKEEYILKTKETSEMDEVIAQYEKEDDFRRKIILKKKIEEFQNEQKEMINAFHEEMGALEIEAARMQEMFENEVVKKPQLFIKIVIKF